MINKKGFVIETLISDIMAVAVYFAGVAICANKYPDLISHHLALIGLPILLGIMVLMDVRNYKRSVIPAAGGR